MGVKKQLRPVGGQEGGLGGDKSSRIKHMICIYDCVEIHDTVSPSGVRRPCGAGGAAGGTAPLQQKPEVSTGNISQRVRYCE